jgi:hypothetical protein
LLRSGPALVSVLEEGVGARCNLGLAAAPLSLGRMRQAAQSRCVSAGPGSGRHADLAVSALRRAVALGYRDAAVLRSDPDLEPLRWRPEFRLLLDAAFPPTRSRGDGGLTRPLPRGPALRSIRSPTRANDPGRSDASGREEIRRGRVISVLRTVT